MGTATAFKDNLDALKEFKFNMRLVHGVTEPDTWVTILGKELDLPVLAVPIGGVSFNMGGEVREEDYVRAIIRRCFVLLLNKLCDFDIDKIIQVVK